MLFRSDQYHTYNVTALYSTGESAPSNEVTVSTTSGIDDISSDNLIITTKNGCIIICGANGRKIKVYTPDGLTTFNDNVTSDIHINVNPGIYIIDTVTDVFKVLVIEKFLQNNPENSVRRNSENHTGNTGQTACHQNHQKNFQRMGM